MVTDEIHWAAYDGATGDLVSWGTGSTLDIVIGQVGKIRSLYDGWLTVEQLEKPLESTRSDLKPHGPVTEAQRVTAVRNALTALRNTVRTALDCQVAPPQLAAVTRAALVDVRSLIWPGNGPDTLPETN